MEPSIGTTAVGEKTRLWTKQRTLNSEEIKPAVAIAIIELCLSEGISQSVSQSVSRKFN